MKLREMLNGIRKADEHREEIYSLIQRQAGSQLQIERGDDISQRELAEKMGVSISWISKVENGKVLVSKRALEKIVKALEQLQGKAHE